MTHQSGISRHGSIKTTAALVGSLIGITVGFPTVAYRLSPPLHKGEDDSSVDLGSLENYPIDIPTRFEFTQSKVT
jgi:hypothetical protein